MKLLIDDTTARKEKETKRKTNQLLLLILSPVVPLDGSNNNSNNNTFIFMKKDSFDELWKLLERHGVVPGKKADCARLWATYTIDQQRKIYASISRKITGGRFVHYDPVRAVAENAPRTYDTVLTYEQYYARFHTTEEQGGWHMVKPENGNVYYEHG